MRARPVFVKLAAFFLTFAAALLLVSEIRHVRYRVAMNERLRSSPPRPFRLSDDLSFGVGLVTLDRENARSYTQLNLYVTRRPHMPEKLWVRTFFFSPDDATGRIWGGEAIELNRPFDEHGNASVTVAAPCSWCADPQAPRGGYFARVQITDGREETSLPLWSQFRDISTAAPVVVHAERPLILRP
jgi:hypothetical protein